MRLGKSDSAVQEARDFIARRFGNDSLPEQAPEYKSKSANAQEAHEAIRPTSVMREPESIKAFLEPAMFKLYNLIWQRFVASQMEAAVYDTLQVEVTGSGGGQESLLRASGSTLRFAGFLAVYEEARNEDLRAEEDEENVKIPADVAEGQAQDLIRVIPEQHFTQPPPRLFEASLVQLLEEDGIGRPSTYAPIISTIQQRFLGLMGMIDPPREEARQAIQACKQAGIRVAMITGDNPHTATAIAAQLGICEPEETALTGREIEAMNDEQLQTTCRTRNVYARIEPLHKLRIVNTFKRDGHGAAMTGDGVNDAPALEAAGIGVAMGITGTDVAKEAADMVLADDNFESIVAAVEEGRIVFNRLRNVTFFLLLTCTAELMTLFLSVALYGESPLEPIQILCHDGFRIIQVEKNGKGEMP